MIVTASHVEFVTLPFTVCANTTLLGFVLFALLSLSWQTITLHWKDQMEKIDCFRTSYGSEILTPAP
jgi:hypothetical protein